MNKKLLVVFAILLALSHHVLVAQEIPMQSGNISACAPQLFTDSGGSTGNYLPNENYELTLCPENSGDVLILNFTFFNIGDSDDTLSIFNGLTTESPLIGQFTGLDNPGLIAATNPSGCLTILFSSNSLIESPGWIAELNCEPPCQEISALIDSTSPEVNTSGEILVLPGQNIDFSASAVFSESDVGSNFEWDFGDGTSGSGTNVTKSYNLIGIYKVDLTVSDASIQGCSDNAQVTVIVSNPIISINDPANAESFFGPEQLIKDLLVSGGCSEVDNFEIAAEGAPDQLEGKSYGYFNKAGSLEFPFEEGIVLSTGLAAAAGNATSSAILNNTLGTPGDNDLEEILNAGASSDATSIKFNFTPTANRISFRYIMASEEYVNGFECTFSDGFVFLLREVGTDEYINIAKLPNGDEVTVTNINNSPTCASNTEFFEGYNIGNTNFNGRTKVLTAEADVVANVTYELKIVVADLVDNQYDSAIFLEAGSFNLGGDLGEDITIAAGNAECGGTEIILDTEAPTAIHTWFKDGIKIDGITSSTLNVSESGLYSVDIFFGVGCEISDTILVEFRLAPTVDGSPKNLVNCGDSGSSTFNLNSNTPLILGNQNLDDFNVTYYTNLQDAEDKTNPISNPTDYNGIDQELIFARIDDDETQTCFEISSFNLEVVTSITPQDYQFSNCDSNLVGSDTDGVEEFDLSLIDSEVLGDLNPAQYNISFHRNQTDAESRINPIQGPYINTVAGNDVVVARVENIDNIDCFGTSLVTLIVEALPTTASSTQLLQCDTDTDGFTAFNLTESEALISSNAVNETFSYHFTFADAEANDNPISNIETYTNIDPSSNADVIFVRVSNSSGCYRVSQLELLVSTTTIPADLDLLYEVCDDKEIDNDNTNGVASFDFSDATVQITERYPVGQDISVSYYENMEDALAESNAIANTTNYRNESSPFEQKLVVRIDNSINNSCLGIGERITLRTVNPQPKLDPKDLVLCDSANSGDLIELFDLRQNETYIFDGRADLIATYHLSLLDAESDVNTISNPSSYPNSSAEQTIYVRVSDINTGCYATVDFDIMVEPLPLTIEISDLLGCEVNTDGIFDFQLESKTEEILAGQSPVTYQVSYHLTQDDAQNLDNALPSSFTNTSNPQPIYVAIRNIQTGCSVSTQSFLLEVEEAAQVNPDNIPVVYELCDTVNANDGSTQFELSSQNSVLLDGQDPSRFTLSYHPSMEDAFTNTNPLPNLYENLSNPQIIYVRISNNSSAGLCFDVGPLTLQVNLLPEVELEERYVLCSSTNGTEVIVTPPLINTGLSGIAYNFEWFYNGNIIPGETAPSLIATQSGSYSVAVTDISTSSLTQCTSVLSTEVIDSDLPELFAEVTTLAFSKRHVIEASATGIGVYEFNLDDGPWQMSGVFEDVSNGTHVIKARDRNGCGEVSTEVEVMDYPLFFTPNGDGNNDLWRVPGIENQPNAKIYIFDRYGKLLKQLIPDGEGWDGTFNGSVMPSDDYWFTINYEEPRTGEPKIFKAHFTLKR